MSGFTNEVFIKISNSNNLTSSEITNIFIKGIHAFFGDSYSVKPIVEKTKIGFDIYFFVKIEGKEKLYSFILTLEENLATEIKYVSFTDNSFDTSLLFWNDNFFNSIVDSFKVDTEVSKVIWLADSDYNSIREVFDRYNYEAVKILTFENHN